MNVIENLLSLPTYMYLVVISSFVTGFILWRGRKKVLQRSEAVFDFIIIFIFCSFLFGRLFFIFDHLSEFKSVSWSIFPYFYEPGAERIWLKQLPWLCINFWDNGVDFSGLIFGGIFYTLIRFKNIILKFPDNILEALCIGQVLLLIGFFFEGYYFGKPTDLWFGVVYTSVDEIFRIPIQFIEILTLLLLLAFFQYFKKIHRKQNILTLYLIAIGSIETIVIFLSDLGRSSWIYFSQIPYLFLVITGLILFILNIRFDTSSLGSITQTNNSSLYTHGSESTHTTHGGRSSQLQYSYRDFQSSFSTYRNSKPSFFGKIKRFIQRVKQSIS